MRYRNAHPRAGVSLLEVMFSIGVAFIGLLGVMALVPVALTQMARGLVTDYANAFGRAAVQEFEARQMHHPNNWMLPVGPNSYHIFQANALVNKPSFTGTPPAQPQPVDRLPYNWNPTVGLAQGASFCIDPLLIGGNIGSFPGPGNAPYIDMFPAVEVNDPALEARMARVTLRARPGAASAIDPGVASEIFFLTDDLIFSRPRDRTLPPVPELTGNKRQSEAKLSWMATLTPFLQNGGAGYGNNVNAGQDLYTLSIVVFDRRALDGAYENERVVQVGDFYSEVQTPNGPVAQAGGGVKLVTRPNRANNPDDLEVRSGDWVMLSQRFGANGRSYFRWYRVVYADRDPVPQARGSQSASWPPYDWWALDVELAGADWPVTSPSTETQVTIIRGVVAVLEKTIRLENSSLWVR